MEQDEIIGCTLHNHFIAVDKLPDVGSIFCMDWKSKLRETQCGGYLNLAVSIISTMSLSTWYPPIGEKWPSPDCCRTALEYETTSTWSVRLVTNRTNSRNRTSDASSFTWTNFTLSMLQAARHANWSIVIPFFSIISKGMQQSSMFSWYQRHGPFHTLFGSTSRVFKTMTNVDKPQKAGSSWVLNWAASWKYPSMWPVRSASLKIFFPSSEQNDIQDFGRVLR